MKLVPGRTLLILDSELFKNSDCFIFRGIFLVPRPLSEQVDTLNKGIKKLEEDKTY